MNRFDVGDRVRIDIPDKSDPDHEPYHGEHGEVVTIIQDDSGEETGDERESMIYRIQLDSGDVMDFRWRDLRPPMDEK